MRTKTTLSIDVGASHVKAQTLGPRGSPRSERMKVDTPDSVTPKGLTNILVDIARQLGDFDRVSVGLPGIVHRGVVYSLPLLGDRRLHSFPLVKVLERELQRPVRIVNDAELHGLGVIRRKGVELILTLGTGLGTALYLDGEIGPRIQFLPRPGKRDPIGGAYGNAARKKLGNARWSERVHRVIEELRRATNFDRCYVGGGNAKDLRGRLARGVSRVDNSAAAIGGVRLWEWDIET
jgi:polyphosphate glucokinase